MKYYLQKVNAKNYSGTFVCEIVINFTKHNHVLYYVERVDLYSVETVIIYLKTIFIVFINVKMIFTLFSIKLLWRVSSSDVPYLCNI